MSRYITVALLTAISTFLLVKQCRTTIAEREIDQRDAVVDSIIAANDSLTQWRDSALASVPDTLTIIKTETRYEVRQRFIDYYGAPDTVHVFECDSAQMERANENKVRLDSCRVAAKVLSIQLKGCEKGTRILLDQRDDERRRVALLEQLNAAKWWQVVKRCRIKRKLKR